MGKQRAERRRTRSGGSRQAFAACGEDLRRIGEEVSERYEYVPAQMMVIEDACACKIVRASKPAQPIEKSTASASVLAQVIMSNVADHLLLHR
jgi:transposase